MTPEYAWEIYVGSQSPREFFELSGESSPAEAVGQYVAASQLCDDFSEDEKDGIYDLLLEHLRSSLGLDD